MRRIAQCGTVSGYNRHRRRGEAACSECLAANADRKRQWYTGNRDTVLARRASRRVDPELKRLGRFAAKVEFSDSGCWLWRGSLDSSGYGGVKVAGRMTKAHRWAYELLVGPIPEGLQMDHLCRVRSCVNPDHLEPVTCQENVRRGVSNAAHNARKTRCDKGHVFDESNTRWRTGAEDGGRVCRTCERAAGARYRARKRLRATVMLLVMLSAVLMVSPASAHSPSLAKRVCHRHSVQRLIRCYAGRIKPPGGAAKALAVAECESGFNRLAVSGPHVGLYQHVRSSWAWRANHYMVGVPGSRDWRSARAQVVVSMKMAKAQGSWAVSWSCG